MTEEQISVYTHAKDAIDSINNASAITRTLFISLMSVSAYLAVVIASTNDLDLLLYTPVKLPILGVEIDLKSFYTWTPWMYLIIHAYTLLNLSLLTEKLDYFDLCCTRLDYEQRLHLRKQLHIHSFTQYIGAANEGIVKPTLSLLNWFTMTTLPLGILLFLLFDFLPAQEISILRGQRWAIVIDALLCCVFWNVILQKRRNSRLPRGWKPPLWRRIAHSGLSLIIIATIVVYLAVFVAVIPLSAWERGLQQGEYFGTEQLSWHDVVDKSRDGTIRHREIPDQQPNNTEQSSQDDYQEDKYKSLIDVWDDQIQRAIVYRIDKDQCKGLQIVNRGCMSWYLFDRGNSLLGLHRSLTIQGEILSANTLDSETKNAFIKLRDKDSINGNETNPEGNKVPTSALDKVNPLNLSSRWLRFADFKRTILPKVILGHAQLQGSKFENSILIELTGENAYLQQSDLRSATLQNTSLKEAYLQEAILNSSDLHGADLTRAKLQGAGFHSAKLLGANFSSAELHGTKFYSSDLQGADFSSAELQGADFSTANLQGSSFTNAELQGADFFSAKLNGADLGKAQLQGANFKRAKLLGTNLTDVDLSYSILVELTLGKRWTGSDNFIKTIKKEQLKIGIEQKILTRLDSTLKNAEKFTESQLASQIPGSCISFGNHGDKNTVEEINLHCKSSKSLVAPTPVEQTHYGKISKPEKGKFIPINKRSNRAKILCDYLNQNSLLSSYIWSSSQVIENIVVAPDSCQLNQRDARLLLISQRSKLMNSVLNEYLYYAQNGDLPHINCHDLDESKCKEKIRIYVISYAHKYLSEIKISD